MKFHELLKQKYCNRTNKIDIECLRNNIGNTPDDVLEQFYSDHGRCRDFQKQYAHVDTSKLTWIKTNVEANRIIECGIYESFDRWLQQVSSRIDAFETKGWSALDARDDVVSHWSDYGTWMRSPIFIPGSIINRDITLWLVEGHTRVGVLKGLVQRKILQPTSLHSIWLAKKITS